MPFKLDSAVPADAGRIADIHMDAFASNGMLLAQFSTPKIREGLREAIRQKALADIEDSKITVLVVRDIPPDPAEKMTPEDSGSRPSASYGGLERVNTEKTIAGKVISFAKWSHPVEKDEDYKETPWVWPSGTNMNVLESWTAKTDKAQEQTVGNKPCYRLTFMGTDPAYERRGAASMMVRWGLERCKEYHVPGYLESTLNAAQFYRKMGFKATETISLQYALEGQNQKYEETAFVYHSSSA
ncbi:putative GNAT family acetyltransferase [Nemania sp. FL0031]|nr:putative GNAT family acetyltransferase [Nemania sp. FL0031]